jgi:hypothetical protein
VKRVCATARKLQKLATEAEKSKKPINDEHG